MPPGNTAVTFAGGNINLNDTNFGAGIPSGISASFWFRTTSSASNTIAGVQTANAGSHAGAQLFLMRFNENVNDAFRIFLRETDRDQWSATITKAALTAAGVPAVNNGQWRHRGVTMSIVDTTNMSAFLVIDGQVLPLNLVHSIQTGCSAVPTSGTFNPFINFDQALSVSGVRAGNATLNTPFNGDLAHIAIFTGTPLTTAQLQAQYNSAIPEPVSLS